jgi:hypothetical protein
MFFMKISDLYFENAEFWLQIHVGVDNSSTLYAAKQLFVPTLTVKHDRL